MLFTGGGDVATKLAKTPRTTIAELEDGAQMKASGMVLETSDTKPALLSGAAGVCTRTIVDVAFGRTSGWLHLVDHFQCQPFRLKDETGEVLVDSRHVRLAGAVDSDSFDSITQADRLSLSELLGASQFGFTSWETDHEFRDAHGFCRGVRVRETLLAPHDRAFVLGYVRHEVSRSTSQKERTYRSVVTEPVLCGSRRRPLLIAKGK